MNEYSFLAASYDLLLNPFLAGVRRRVVNLVTELNPAGIVDLCCGTGHQLKLLKQAGYDNLICIDLSEDMLRIASKGRHAPECRLKDVSNTEIPDESVELVIVSLALHEKPRDKVLEVINEAQRILKPNGNLVVCDYTADGTQPFYASAFIRFIEFMVGGEHWLNYKEYMKFGGLDNLRKDVPFDLRTRYSVAAGGIAVELWNVKK